MSRSGIITIPFHIGDFLGGTLHMDTLEKGAYLMLLLAHYQIGFEGLPNDPKKLSRIAGVTLKVWERISPVLSEKFETGGNFWVSKKVVEVLRKVEHISSQNSAKALKNKRVTTASADPLISQPKPKPKPSKRIEGFIEESLSLSSPNQKELTPVSFTPEEKKFPESFETFFREFPSKRKDTKLKTFSAWQKAIQKINPEELNQKTILYAKSKEVENGYAKGSVAWLNAEKWTNDFSPPKERKQENVERYIEDAAQRIIAIKSNGSGQFVETSFRPELPHLQHLRAGGEDDGDRFDSL